MQVGLAAMRRVKWQRHYFAGTLGRCNQRFDPGVRTSFAQQVAGN